MSKSYPWWLAAVIAASGCSLMPTEAEPTSEAAEPIQTQTQTLSTQATRHRPPAAIEEPAEETPEPQPDPDSIYWAMQQLMAMDKPDLDRIQVYEDFYSRNQDYINRVSERGQRYLPHILAEIEARNLPAELALVPIIESAFDPFAYSHGRAAGIWQFIPSTGRHFGLEQDWWYDARRDILAATDVALNYLEQHYNTFGDWHLALAAYNSGAGTVIRARNANRERGLDDDYWSLRLPTETMQYVPKILGLAKVIASPDDYGIVLPEISRQPYFAKVDIGGQIDLAQVASLAKVELDELYRLNPGLNRWATPPQGPHHLLVPTQAAETLALALADLPPQQRVSWQRHAVRNGDTLLALAKQYQTTVAVIQQANQLNSHVIRVGQELMIPQASQDNYDLSADQRLASRQNSAPNGRQHRLEHQVAAGESFWLIARRYSTDVRTLARWNNMAPGDTLRAGQTLVVWLEQEDEASQGNSSQPVVLASTQQRAAITRPVSYQVRNGDNLSSIAQRFGVSVGQIESWNDVGRYLQPGQTLRLQVPINPQ